MFSMNSSRAKAFDDQILTPSSSPLKTTTPKNSPTRDKMSQDCRGISSSVTILRPRSPTKCSTEERGLMEFVERGIKDSFNGGVPCPWEDIICAFSATFLFRSSSGAFIPDVDMQMYWCNFCSFKSKEKREMVNHSMSHRFKCNYCDQECFTRFDVVKHSIRTHSEYKLTRNALKACMLLRDLLEQDETSIMFGGKNLDSDDKTEGLHLESDQQSTNSKHGSSSGGDCQNSTILFGNQNAESSLKVAGTFSIVPSSKKDSNDLSNDSELTTLPLGITESGSFVELTQSLTESNSNGTKLFELKSSETNTKSTSAGPIALITNIQSNVGSSENNIDTLQPLISSTEETGLQIVDVVSSNSLCPSSKKDSNDLSNDSELATLPLGITESESFVELTQSLTESNSNGTKLFELKSSETNTESTSSGPIALITNIQSNVGSSENSIDTLQPLISSTEETGLQIVDVVSLNSLKANIVTLSTAEENETGNFESLEQLLESLINPDKASEKRKEPEIVDASPDVSVISEVDSIQKANLAEEKMNDPSYVHTPKRKAAELLLDSGALVDSSAEEDEDADPDYQPEKTVKPGRLLCTKKKKLELKPCIKEASTEKKIPMVDNNAGNLPIVMELWRCGYCHHHSLKKWKIEAHIKEKHSSKSIKYSRQILNANGDEKNKEKYTCMFCNYKSANMQIIRQHGCIDNILKQKGKNFYTFFCCRSKCNFLSVNPRKYIEHVEKCTQLPKSGNDDGSKPTGLQQSVTFAQNLHDNEKGDGDRVVKKYGDRVVKKDGDRVVKKDGDRVVKKDSNDLSNDSELTTLPFGITESVSLVELTQSLTESNSNGTKLFELKSSETNTESTSAGPIALITNIQSNVGSSENNIDTLQPLISSAEETGLQIVDVVSSNSLKANIVTLSTAEENETGNFESLEQQPVSQQNAAKETIQLLESLINPDKTSEKRKEPEIVAASPDVSVISEVDSIQKANLAEEKISDPGYGHTHKRKAAELLVDSGALVDSSAEEDEDADPDYQPEKTVKPERLLCTKKKKLELKPCIKEASTEKKIPMVDNNAGNLPIVMELWQCNYCHHHTLKKRNLEAHIKEKHSSRSINYTRLILNANKEIVRNSFDEKPQISCEFEIKSSSSPPTIKNDDDDGDEKNKEKYACMFCNYKSANVQIIRQHMFRLHPSKKFCCINNILKQKGKNFYTFLCSRYKCNFLSMNLHKYIEHVEKCTPLPKSGKDDGSKPTGLQQSVTFAQNLHDNEKGDGDRVVKKDGDRVVKKDGDQVVKKDGDRVVNKDGDQVVNKDGDRVANKDGDRVVKKDGDRVVKKDGDRVVNKDGDRVVKKDGDRVVKKDGDRAVKKDGDRAVKKNGDRAVKKDGDRAVKKDGDRAVKKDGDRVVKKDGDRVVKKDGDRVVKKDGDRVVMKDGDRVVTKDGDRVVTKDGDRVVKKDGDRVVKKDGDRVVKKDSGETRDYSCHWCAFSAVGNDTMKNHMLTDHPNLSMIALVKKPDSTLDFYLFCPEENCKYITQRKHELVIHRKQNHTSTCLIDDDDDSKDIKPFADQQMPKDGDPIEKNTMTYMPAYECLYCETSCISTSLMKMKRHVQETHPNEVIIVRDCVAYKRNRPSQIYVCDAFGCIFNDLDYKEYLTHTTAHKGGILYGCANCNWVGQDKKDFGDHMKRQTGVKHSLVETRVIMKEDGSIVKENE